MKKQYLCSTSGGETSATMAKLIKDRNKLQPVLVFKSKGKPHYTKYVNDEMEVIFVFANMSREDNRTLTFVENLKRYWGISCIWVEADVQAGRIGTKHKIVTYQTCKRDGSVFEGIISKYGIPNKVYIHCTREGKKAPIDSLAKSIGWTDYTTIIGYRADEPKRVNLINAAKSKQWYPLYEWGIVKDDIKNFWRKQPFNLGLLEFEGNCRLCYKKSKRKLLTQMLSDPKSTEWTKQMEDKYRFFQKKNRNVNNFPENGIMFFRENESISDLIEESKHPFDKWVEPVKSTMSLFDIELDSQDGCEESCEPFTLDADNMLLTTLTGASNNIQT